MSPTQSMFGVELLFSRKSKVRDAKRERENINIIISIHIIRRYHQVMNSCVSLVVDPSLHQHCNKQLLQMREQIL